LSRGGFTEVFSSTPARTETPQQHPPAVDISGAWDVDIEYEVGSSRHKLLLVAHGNRVSGFHEGWASSPRPTKG
jgi:hypothetical protein